MLEYDEIFTNCRSCHIHRSFPICPIHPLKIRGLRTGRLTPNPFSSSILSSIHPFCAVSTQETWSLSQRIRVTSWGHHGQSHTHWHITMPINLQHMSLDCKRKPEYLTKTQEEHANSTDQISVCIKKKLLHGIRIHLWIVCEIYRLNISQSLRCWPIKHSMWMRTQFGSETPWGMNCNGENGCSGPYECQHHDVFSILIQHTAGL